MTPELAYLEGPHGALFAVRHSTVVPRRRLLLLPPFGEELNKCRALLTRTAAALVADGVETLLVDLHGTGDSAGEFGAASWTSWLDELEFALDALGNEVPIGLFAVRSGALFVPELLARRPGRVDRALFWQPVSSGNQFLKQLLRLRVMASKFAGVEESVAGLQQELARGAAVEIAGYEIAPALAAAISAVKLAAPALQGLARVDIVEFMSGADPTLPVRQLVAAVGAAGGEAHAEVVDCEQFWASQELAQPAAAIASAVRLCAASMAA